MSFAMFCVFNAENSLWNSRNYLSPLWSEVITPSWSDLECLSDFLQVVQ